MNPTIAEVNEIVKGNFSDNFSPLLHPFTKVDYKNIPRGPNKALSS